MGRLDTTAASHDHLNPYRRARPGSFISCHGPCHDDGRATVRPSRAAFGGPAHGEQVARQQPVHRLRVHRHPGPQEPARRHEDCGTPAAITTIRPAASTAASSHLPITPCPDDHALPRGRLAGRASTQGRIGEVTLLTSQDRGNSFSDVRQGCANRSTVGERGGEAARRGGPFTLLTRMCQRL